MLNPQWLKTFEALAELGSFTRVAEQLGITQAAVSQHVRQMEDRLGPLLVRQPRRIELTPAGRALLEYCLEVCRANQRLMLQLSESDSEKGDVSLITPGSIGLVLYPLLLEWQQQHPCVSIKHRFAPDKEVLDAVLQNHYELGLVTLKPDDPRLAVSRFTEEELELVVPVDWGGCGWDDLARLGFIDHPDGIAMASRLLSRLYTGSPGIRHIPVKGFSNQIGLLLEPVARGLGFTVIPRYARLAFACQDKVRVVQCGNPVLDTIWLIHRTEWPLSSRAERVVEYLQAQVAQGGERLVKTFPLLR